MYDYVYIDGFAHTGEEGGKTISDFWVHLRMGGIIAGDDYHSDWPLVLWAVADFASKTGCSIYVTTQNTKLDGYNGYPSWMAIKKNAVPYKPSKILRFIASYEKMHVYLKMWLKRILGK